jgi:hypothetical protein
VDRSTPAESGPEHSGRKRKAESGKRKREAATEGRLAAFAAGLAGSAVLGLAAGAVWAAVAPRPLLQEVTAGQAQLVNAESSAFITADAWFCLITAAGGVITGALGYRLLVRRAGWIAAAGLILGALAAALLAMWIGGKTGLAGYQHRLASAPAGTIFRASLGLGAKSALAFWPMLTSFAIALAESGARRPGQARGAAAAGERTP